ncbi:MULTISPECIES: GFA family protein [unclassified Paracoccus (in: a-proteobacteria)]|uniref:GFA family protein n=1 Tax=unclassified Paracoccus (in: a-proteobacteria) TaxID=2688777 RepID=UPI0012B2567A|nr:MULTISPECIES: GFA family protein [unclassified Paracoccus (in: a-proteobacteria)]UXU75748.1 GFA family protein [Paracoccus sp. SMMA_5]UXU81655.1 GFA family protein [Paracoccus sp. SMMA_5_TC]
MNVSDVTEFRGHCLCGRIRFHGTYDAGHDLRACHCSQCRRWSGHVWAAILPRSLTIEGEPAWYRASEIARRGFCRDCGSSLFWQRDGSPIIDVAAGAIDSPTGLRMLGHIFVADKGDYYDIADGLPQNPQE